jgi:hypothetical protein
MREVMLSAVVTFLKIKIESINTGMVAASITTHV